MKLKEARDIYYERSGKVSDLTRQLAFAGIAVVWIYKVGPEAHPSVAPSFLIPLILFAVTLLFDFLQAVSGAGVWGAFARVREKRCGSSTDVEIGDAPDAINWFPIFFFWSKVVVLLWGFGFLIFNLAKILFAQPLM